MQRAAIGIIGGSGLYDMDGVTDREAVTLSTPFGEPSGPYLLGTLRGRRVAFLARHGAGHRLSPSELNFRANIFGLKTLGVEYILSASAVGSGSRGSGDSMIRMPFGVHARRRPEGTRTANGFTAPSMASQRAYRGRPAEWPSTVA